jgi:S-adenosylmethionine:tRNA ribosyltransferase-isomerase
VRTADFHYELPPELIAQTPAPERDQSRLLVFQRPTGQVTHRWFRDLPSFLQAGDVLVLNDSRVIAARLRGEKPGTGGQLEVLLTEENAVNDWWVMLRPGKRVRTGTRFLLRSPAGEVTSITATVLAKDADGCCRLRFDGVANVAEALDMLGEVPLPSYIERIGAPSSLDRERYQTVFAQPPGSVAAPTAGLHFTAAMLNQLRRAGVDVQFVTLHVGLGTFAPVKAGQVEDHVMHQESFELSAATADAINRAKDAGRRVMAVGTTTVRVLESVAAENAGALRATRGRTRIFIHPPFRFRVADALVTNFHLPESTLLMLVSALATPGETGGRELMLAAYTEAVRERYRFFSYGDAMLIV